MKNCAIATGNKLEERSNHICWLYVDSVDNFFRAKSCHKLHSSDGIKTQKNKTQPPWCRTKFIKAG